METSPLSEEPSKIDSEPAESQPVSEEEATRQQNIFVDGLKAVVGSTGGPLEDAINDFLSGKGELHETTAAAVTRGGCSAVSDVGSVLEKQFDLNPAIAKLVASLLVKLVPSLKKAKKAKPRRKPKTAASAKKETTAKKKAKKKTTAKPAAKKKTAAKTSKKTSAAKAKPKKKASAAKPAAKKKTTVKKAKKTATTKKKAKKATRSESIDAAE
jgi:hypothetical protein